MQVFSNMFELLVNVFEAFVLVHFIFSFIDMIIKANVQRRFILPALLGMLL